MKTRLTILLLLMTICIGCQDIDISQRIYEKVFANASFAVIYALDVPNTYNEIIDKSDLATVRTSIKNIHNVTEYIANLNPSGTFKQGFHMVHVCTEQGNQTSTFKLLYSINEKAMIIRKSDLSTYKDPDPLKVAVYEFNIPDDIVNILEKHENILPKGAIFFESWIRN